MSRFVLDASAAIAVVLGQKRGEPLLEPLGSATSVTAPDLFVAEVANSLSKYVRLGELSPDSARAALDEALNLVDELVPVSGAAAEVLAESIRLDHPAYDLCYAVTARRADATLLTLDSRLIRLLDRIGVRHAP